MIPAQQAQESQQQMQEFQVQQELQLLVQSRQKCRTPVRNPKRSSLRELRVPLPASKTLQR
jgi:hypothetical protein